MNDKLQKLIESGESQTVEFKSAFNTDVIETAVAFANTSGGNILIGLSNTGQRLNTQFGAEALRDYVNRIATATMAIQPIFRSKYLKMHYRSGVRAFCLII